MKLTPEQLEKAARAAFEAVRNDYTWETYPLRLRSWMKDMVTAAFAAIEPEPVDVPGDLVEKMLDLVFPKPDSWRDYCDEDRREFRNGMTAALRVVLADPRVLGEPTDSELHLAQVRTSSPNYEQAFRSFVSERRARLTQPKTPESRVQTKIEPELKVYRAEVLELDGRVLQYGELIDYARLGLVAKLKEQSQ